LDPRKARTAMQPYLEKAVDLAREHASYFAPYENVADPLIDSAEEGMTAAMIIELLPGSSGTCNRL
jgi:carboxypeptidase Taq